MIKILGEKSYFTMIPNIVDDMVLSPYAFRLYVHIKRVAGDAGACWQSINTISQICNMSTGKVSEAKAELVEAGLIYSEIKVGDKGNYSEVKVVDIWQVNYSNAGITHHMGKLPHHMGNPSPLSGDKEEPINNTPNLTERDFSNSTKMVTEIIRNSDKSKTHSYTDIPEVYIPYAQAFVEATGIRYIKKYFSDWCATFSDWQNLGYQPSDIFSAVESLVDENKTGMISRPGSLDWKMRAIIADRTLSKNNDPYKSYKRFDDE